MTTIPAYAGMTDRSAMTTIPAYAGMTDRSLMTTIPAYAGMTDISPMTTIPAYAGMTDRSAMTTIPAYAGMTDSCHSRASGNRYPPSTTIPICVTGCPGASIRHLPMLCTVVTGADRCA
jgi:hypothetical protein